MKSLSEIEKIVGLKRRAIQEYEEAGLAIKPTHKNKYGYLLYDTPEIERLWQLKFYKEIGYNITKIKEIQARGNKAEKAGFGDVISELKEKRDKLNNLISIAEMMNTTGWSFNDMRNLIVPTDDIHADNLFEVLGVVLSIMIFENVEDCIDEDIFTDEKLELIFSYIENILDCFDKNLEYTSELVQMEITNLHKAFSEILPGSVHILQMIILDLETHEELRKDLGEEKVNHIISALRYYCDEHKDNTTDRILIDALSNIEKLGLRKYTTNCEEVQNEVNNIYISLEAIKIFKPKARKMYLKNIGKLFESQAYKNLIDSGAQKGVAWFISRAIKIYIDNMEKEISNG